MSGEIPILDTLTYEKNIPVSLVQYLILIGVLTGSVATTSKDDRLNLTIGIILSFLIQVFLWIKFQAMGISIIYCIILGFMTLQDNEKNVGALPGWTLWLILFLVANLISIVSSRPYIGNTGVIIMTIAHCIGFLIGVLISFVSEKISHAIRDGR